MESKINIYLGIVTIATALLIRCTGPDLDLLDKYDFFKVMTENPKTETINCVRLSGIFISENQQTNLDKYGFYWSTSQQDLEIMETGVDSFVFSIPLEGTNFDTLASFSDLNQIYYVRAFAADGNRRAMGAIKSFAFNFKVEIEEVIKINNDQAIVGGIIVGLANLPSVKDHGHVFSYQDPLNESGSEIFASKGPIGINGSFDNILNNLEFNSKYFIRAYVFSHRDQLIYSPTMLEIQTKDGWKFSNDIEANLRISTGISMGNRAFVGIGCGYECNTETPFLSFFEFKAEEPTNSKWVRQKDFPGSARVGSVSFSIDNKIYVGLGFLQDPSGLNIYFFQDFWEFYPDDPEGIYWREMTKFKGCPSSDAVAFSVGSLGYVGSGLCQDGNYSSNFWAFNPALNGGKGDWIKKDSLPVKLESGEVAIYGRKDAHSFVIGNEAFVGGGRLFRGDVLSDFWVFNPELPKGQQWSSKYSVPELRRFSAVGFSVGNRGFISTGTSDNRLFYNDLWEFNADGNGGMGEWKHRTDYQSFQRKDAISFTVNGKAYVGLGQGLVLAGVGDTLYGDLWEYTPPIQ